MSHGRREKVTASHIRRYEALIFFTGAVTLSLEVLASRIMTPYFGVSLYIWAGILSITLVFLACGYHLGGRISLGRSPVSLQVLLLIAPVTAALFLVLAAFFYPLIFPLLSGINLIVASFLGSAVLLAVPLVVLSAMNPWLIALAREGHAGGDAGAGRVFFISTIGSVAGVVLTAFVMIPNLSNWCGVIWLGLLLGLLAGLMAWVQRELPRRERTRLIALGLAVACLGGALLAGQRVYFRILAGAAAPGQELVVLAQYPSVFGNIKVVAARDECGEFHGELLYLQDGIIQNHVSATGEALDHTGELLPIIGIYAPVPGHVLILGLGAGILPQALKRRGWQVTVVEINPQSLRAAREFFGFNPEGMRLYEADARTLVRRWHGAFDLAVVDLFQGDGTPDYLLTWEFFRDLHNCLRPQGLAVINAFFDPENEAANQRLLATVAGAYPHLLEFRTPTGDDPVDNAYILAAGYPLPAEPALAAARKEPGLSEKNRNILLTARPLNRESLSGIAPVSDRHNIFSLLLAGSQMRYRNQFNRLPWHLLVN